MNFDFSFTDESQHIDIFIIPTQFYSLDQNESFTMSRIKIFFKFTLV